MLYGGYLFILKLCARVCVGVNVPECSQPWRPEQGVRLPEAGIALDCGCWELNLRLLEEQQVHSSAELFLQPLSLCF